MTDAELLADIREGDGDDVYDFIEPGKGRALLRFRFVEGAPVERVATMYGVHRTTITRWLTAIRATLLDETGRILTAELGATGAELDSLAELVRSQLHVSVVRLLREPDGEPTGARPAGRKVIAELWRG